VTAGCSRRLDWQIKNVHFEVNLAQPVPPSIILSENLLNYCSFYPAISTGALKGTQNIELLPRVIVSLSTTGRLMEGALLSLCHLSIFDASAFFAGCVHDTYV